MKKEIWLVASGDSRLSANQKCWQAQSDSEAALIKALNGKGWEVKRAHAYDDGRILGVLQHIAETAEILEAGNACTDVLVRIGEIRLRSHHADLHACAPR